MKLLKRYNNDEPNRSKAVEQAIIEKTIDVIKETTRCFTEYSQCKEREKSERKKISAQLRAYLKKVDAIKEIELAKIRFTHEERMKLLDTANRALEIAKQNGDSRIVKMTFEFINVTLNKVGYVNQISTNENLLIED